jgi:excisionase family DNA binding protein
VSLKEAALIVGVHTDTIRRAVSSGDLAAYRIGKQYRIAAADLDRWIEGKRVEPSEGFSRTIYGSPTNEYRW